MYNRLFIGNNIISLEEVDSTNRYLKEYLLKDNNTIEGLVVVATNQQSGRGQKGNTWQSEQGKNLTFSIFIKPNIQVQTQFLISKAISLGIVDFLNDVGLSELKIKWPNDIFCKDKKIAGILIENALKGNRVSNSIIGIGLNVNQTEFETNNNPTSIINEKKSEIIDLDELLPQLLFFIEKRYLQIRNNNVSQINKDYLIGLYRLNEKRNYLINKDIIEGEIIGVSSIGRLELKVDDEIKHLDLQEVKFL